MPLSPAASPRHPREQGFMPINNDNGPDGQDGDIPLTKIRTTGSTGARRPGMGDAMSPTNAGEKNGLFHRRTVAGRRKVQREPVLGRQRTGDSEVALNFMGKMYTKVIGASVVTRYLVYVVPVALLLAVPIIVLYATGNQSSPNLNLGTVKQNLNANNETAQPNEPIASTIILAEGPPLFELFVWFMISWLSLWGGKIVAHFLPPVFMFFCGVVSSGTRKYATVLRALEIPLSLFFWALGSWVSFRFKFFNDAIPWVDTVKKILGALFVSSAVYLGEKTIVQLISITYHQRSFANRIKDSKRDVYLLGLLYDASRTLFPMYCPEFEEEDFIINDSIDVMLRRGAPKGHKKSGSVTPMRLVANVGRFGDKVTSVFGNIASEITGKNVFNPNSAHSVVVEALEKARTSEAMARRIWMSFVVEGSDSLSQEDIEEVLGPAHKEHAEECFAAIDADSNGDISLEEMIRKVVEIGKERKAIGHSMKDISQALSVFDRILQFIVLFIVVFVFLAFFQSSFITTLATAGTALLSLSFVFAVTTQEFLGSCIFLFVKHPYDVGDRVDIVGPEKEQLVVEKISLLYTVFTRIDKMQVVQVPNIVLNNLWIENVTRSKAMKEVIDVSISYDTSFEDIELLRAEMEKFVRHPDNSRDFQPDFSFGVYGVGDLDKLQLKVAMKHKSNWHNDTVRATRRSKFICALALALKRVPIYGPGGGGEALGGPTNPTYSVAVSDDDAAAARAKADDAKEGKRMVPTNPARMGSTASKSASKAAEQRAATELNTRDPMAEAADGWGMTIDDHTLNSRDQSLDRRREHDIEAVRQDLLSKTTSQRGRRQAGQTLPAQPVGEDNPSVQLTRFRSNGSNFDVESQTGRPAGFGPSPYGNMTTTIAGGAAAAQTAGGPQGYLAPQPYASGGGSSFAGVPGAVTMPGGSSSSSGGGFRPPPQQGQNSFPSQPPAGQR